MTRFDQHYSRYVSEHAYPRQLRSYKTGAYPDALVYYQGKKLIDFSSSDYLGLAKHPYLIAQSHDYAKRWGTGSGSSRLVRGNLSIYDQIEEELAKALGKETALIMGSGFQTNASMLEALLDAEILGQEPLVYCDKACHASLYSGLRSLKRFQRFHHNDLAHLERLLEKDAGGSQPRFIIAESLYSMEGDQVDLNRLTELAAAYQAVLYLDDAHAIGLYGEQGFGLAPAYSSKIDVIMGTFSKGLGSYGSYIGCSKALRDYLTHRCKSLIYSTALAPPILGAISAALEIVPSLNVHREQVLHYAQMLRDFMDEEELPYGGSTTQIVPWIIGCAEKTRQASQLLEEEGILARAIQTPTVPPKKNRIRFCLSALHSEADLELLFSAIQKVKLAIA